MEEALNVHDRLVKSGVLQDCLDIISKGWCSEAFTPLSLSTMSACLPMFKTEILKIPKDKSESILVHQVAIMSIGAQLERVYVKLCTETDPEKENNFRIECEKLTKELQAAWRQIQKEVPTFPEWNDGEGDCKEGSNVHD